MTSQPVTAGPPIFVIGSPRSGTTLTRTILDRHSNLSCSPETHFLTGLHRLADTNWPRIERFDVDRAYWDGLVRTMFETVHVDRMVSRGKKRWVEKTPGYTLDLDYIDRLFPDARYIHIIRDGRDVVASHQYRWGYRAAVRSVGEWMEHVAAGQRFGAGPAADRYHELRYEALVTSPEQVLKPLFAFLDEAWEPAVLDIEQGSALVASRRAQAGTDTAIFASRVGAGAGELDPFLRRVVMARQGRMLRALGYLN